MKKAKEQETKHKALASVLSYGLHDARRAHDKAYKARHLPNFKEQMYLDNYMNRVVRQSRREGCPVERNDFYRLHPHEQEHLERLDDFHRLRTEPWEL